LSFEGIVEVQERAMPYEVNELLSKGWVLLGVFQVRESEHGRSTIVYVLGRKKTQA